MIQIRDTTARVVFEGEYASIKEAVEAATTMGVCLSWVYLEGADLRGANLSGADLADVDLTRVNLAGADLSGANLAWSSLRDADLAGASLTSADIRKVDFSGANLVRANLDPIRDDIFAVLATYPREVPAVLSALREGRIEGSLYRGECACLVGTIAKAKGISPFELTIDPQRPAERWFLGIAKGDTPATSPVAAITAKWIEEFIANA